MFWITSEDNSQVWGCVRKGKRSWAFFSMCRSSHSSLMFPENELRSISDVQAPVSIREAPGDAAVNGPTRLWVFWS